MKRHSSLVLALLLGTIELTVGPSCAQPSAFSAEIRGAWSEEPQGQILNIEPYRLVQLDQGDLTVLGLVRVEGDQLTLRRSGKEETWRAWVEGERLILEQGGTKKRFRRLERAPRQLLLQPLPVAPSRPLPPQRIQSIQKEIADRFHREQEMLRDSSHRGEFENFRNANAIYLRQLIAEVGWLDSKRFGAKTSVYAVLMAKHTHDLQLMMTVLPYAETDLKNSGDGQTYAVLYDALQLDLGGKQRYGTQVAEDAQGPYVLPLEDPKNVDRYLGEMGLPPLDSYLAEISKAFYPGREVKVRREGG